jgi:hypothetical protein
MKRFIRLILPLAMLAALLLWPAIASPSGSATFAPASDYLVGTAPCGGTCGDFDCDGDLDLVTANATTNNVTVLLGDGSGGFAAAAGSPFAVGTSPRAVAVGDLDRDGDPDLAVANNGTNNVSVLLGNGAGGFAAAAGSPFAVGNSPRAVAVGDLDGDGDLDLVAANSGGGTSSVLLNNGSGVFAPAVNYAAGTAPYAVTTGDFDCDGDLDLAVANDGSNNVSVLLNNGGGVYGGATNYNVGMGPQSIAAGDLDCDGDLDLVTANHTGNNVSVLRGNGAGGFLAATNHTCGTNPSSVALGDFDRNGDPDAAVACEGSGNVYVLLGDGVGDFLWSGTCSVGSAPRGVVVGDLDCDGRPDIAAANNGSNTDSVLLSTTTIAQGIGFNSPTSVAAGIEPRSVATGDWGDCDGWPDLVVADRVSNDVQARFGDGSGGFGPPETHAVGVQPVCVAAADLNDDGHQDFVVADQGSKDVAQLLGGGGGSGACGPPTYCTVGTAPAWVSTSDLDCDGKEEVLVADQGSGDVKILGPGGGGGCVVLKTIGWGTAPTCVEAGDLNRDGLPDLVMVDTARACISVRNGLGALNYAAPNDYAVGAAPRTAAIADVNHDGRLDVVVTNSGGHSCSVLLGGGGGGGLGAATDYVVGAEMHPQVVRLEDVNRDGDLDICVAGKFGTALAVILPGNGDGTFGDGRVLGSSGNEEEGLALADLDGDGHCDVLTANSTTNDVSVFRADSTPPTGSFAISGDAEYATTRSVVLNCDWTGAEEMRFRDEGGTWTSWETCAATKDWTLPAGDGTKTVEAECRDAAQNVTSFFDSIELDMTPPEGTMVINGGDVWTASRDVTLDSTVTGATRMHFREEGGSYGELETYSGTKSWTLSAGDGGKTVEAEYLDPAGNPLHVSDNIVLDLTPPTTHDNYDGRWHNGSVIVTLTADDHGGSGVQSTSFSLDGGLTWANGATPVLNGEGIHRLDYFSTDNVNNVELTHTINVMIDLHAPTTSDNSDAAWHNHDVTVTFTPHDTGGSGIDYTEYSLDSGATWTHSDHCTVTADPDHSKDGVHHIDYRSVDQAGNPEETTKECTVLIDTTPPTTHDTADDNWHGNGDPLYFEGTDARSGLASTHWREGEGAWHSGDYTSPGGDGIHTYHYYSVDNAGNVETTKDCTFKVDAMWPTCWDDAPGGWQDTDVTVHFSAEDLESGVNTSTWEYLVGYYGEWSSGSSVTVTAPSDHANDGEHVVMYTVADYCRSYGSGYCYVRIDTLPPVTTDNAGTSWHNHDVTVNLDPEDAGCGVQKTEYRVDSGSWTEGTSVVVPAPGDHSRDGIHTVWYRSTDNLGHKETNKSCEVRIDTRKPVTTDNADGLWHDTDVTVTLSPTDDRSGVAQTEYRIDGGSWVSGSGIVVEARPDHTNDADHTVSYRTTDNAGNVEEEEHCHVKIDTLPPETTDSTDTAWHAGPYVVTLAPTDTGCGVDRTEYRVDGGAWQTGTTVTLTTWKRGGGSGGRTIEYRSFDNLGHEETAHSCVAQLDCRPPGTTDDAPAGAHNHDVTVHFTATDTQSGVKQTRYCLDGGAWQVGGSVTIPAFEDGSNDGVHWIEYYSIDNVDNPETRRHTCSVTIDTSGGGGLAPAAAPARHAVRHLWRWAHGRLIVHLPHTTRASVR